MLIHKETHLWYILEKENDKQTKTRLNDDRNAVQTCHFTSFFSFLLVLCGSIINNKIKNLEMENRSNLSFLSFSY